MKKELDEKLQDAFPWLKQPELHKEKPYDFIEGYSLYENYGFDEVPDGWYQLIYDLCSEIESIYKEYGQPVTIKLAQVKSKFAQLRFYYDLPGKEVGIHAFDFIGSGSIQMYPKGEENSLESKIAACVRKYETKSKSICESCGADNAELCNEPPIFRWIRTLCPACKADTIAFYNKWSNSRKMEENITKRKC